jgi:hypothetical protein
MSLSAIAAEEQAIQQDMEGVQEHDDAMQQDQPAGSDADNAMASTYCFAFVTSKSSSRTQLCKTLQSHAFEQFACSITSSIAYTRSACSYHSGCAQGEAETARGRRWQI